ncbi:MAG: carbohydrate-binding protein [Candidatus Hydrogenedentota bacterium]
MKAMCIISIFALGAAGMCGAACAQTPPAEGGTVYHVAVAGGDTNPGSAAEPLRTISAAAARAQPGDVITVHTGVYRERITPPRGGTADDNRIVYQAAPGEQVVIKGSEVVTGWEHVENDTWKATVPNTLFGDYNPYADLIAGDWFNPKDRPHHTGAVYLDGRQLTEAAKREEVMQPAGTIPGWLVQAGQDYLLNVAWFRPGAGDQVDAAAFAQNHGTQTAPCDEGGECIGWIEHGDWVTYENVDFGEETTQVAIRAASVTKGGTIEVRLDDPDGKLLGACDITQTGGWQAWKTFTAGIEPTSGEHTVCLAFKGRAQDPVNTDLWFAEVDDDNTTLWGQFPDADPNEHEIEINVRRAVFYPDKPGVNYLTVRGFTMRHAATQWAPPTAEQIGLLGTHWSKGWIIEDNVISHSRCTGVTLGKYGDEYDNTSEDTAEGYVLTIERALENGWSKENIGHHRVRNNTISHCEQAGLVGSLGAVFSTITGNTIHDIHVAQLFTGAEMAGIKLHAAIDTEVSHNRIYRAFQGIWLDWMNQGSRVTGNLLYDNPHLDLFLEVNHGPFLVDNNLFLSNTRALLDVSQGGAYAHNLFTGRIAPHPELNRETPYHPAHTTEVAGLSRIQGGDNRFYNNVFAGGTGLAPYKRTARPMHLAGNVFLGDARPARQEKDQGFVEDADPGLRVEEKNGAVYLHMRTGAWAEKADGPLVTTELLGRAQVPDLPYVNRGGSPIRVDTDYFGAPRDEDAPGAGPFAFKQSAEQAFEVWPKPQM